MKTETLLEQLFFSTVFITATYEDGSSSTGTDFIYMVDTAEDQTANFLVTNKHVTSDAQSVVARFMASESPDMKEPALGSAHQVTVTEPEKAFTGHPDPDIDVTVAPITPWINALRTGKHYVFFRGLTTTHALTRDSAQTLDALEEITFLGYPMGLFDSKNLLPIARRGVTASPIAVDYEGKPIFLIDASVFPGSSGSPVLIAQSGGYATRGYFAMGQRVMFLGVLAGVYERNVPVMTKSPASELYVREVADIGIVYKAETVDATVDLLLNKFGLKRFTAQPADVVAESDTASDPLA